MLASPIDASLPARTELQATDIDSLGRSDLAEILDFVPGLDVRRGGRGEPRLNVRGYDQRATLVTLDGVPIYEPYNGIINLNLFPAEFLDGLAITRGSTSSLYGPNGMAGAIHLHTRRAAVPIGGRVSTTWRDSNFWDARASAVGNQGPTQLLVGGRILDSGGFPVSEAFADREGSRRRFEDGGRRANSDRRELSLFANASHAITATTTLRTTVLASQAELGIPPRTTSFTPRLRRVTRQDLTHAHLALDNHLQPHTDLNAALFYSAYDTREDELDPEQRSSILSAITADSYEVGGSIRGARSLTERARIAVAAQARHARADVSDSASAATSQSDFTTLSTALEAQYTLCRPLRFVAGISFDVQTGGGRGTEWQPNPQVGLTYDIGLWGRMRASAGRKTRFPTLRELFDPLQGNRDLEAEKAWSYELGYATSIDQLDMDIAVFRSDVADLIESSGGRSGDPAPSSNLNDAVLQGVEVGIAWAPLERLGLRANYTFLDAQADNPLTVDAGDRDEIQHRPRHRANLIAEFALPWTTELRIEAQYVSRQVDRFGTSVELDAATPVHMRLAKSFDRRLSIAIGADNVLDEDYEEALGMPRPGRWLFAAVRVAIDGT